MSISRMLEAHLDARGVDFTTVPHPHTGSSMDTAAAAHVPGDRLAKAVMVKDDEDYLMVVMPSDYHIQLGRLHQYLGRDVGLATEAELGDLFPDCERGAVPPVGAAFGRRTLLDRRLLDQPEVFFESGDHETLIRVDAAQFGTLMDTAELVDVGTHI